MERKPYYWREMFTGNWELFEKVLGNPETNIVYDIDGILMNSTKTVLKKFTEKSGIKTDAREINKWEYLTELANKSGLDDDVVKHAEDDWFKTEVLESAQRYLYIRPVVEKTLEYYGPDKNFVLTSRNPYLKDSTIDTFRREFPKIKPENIFIRGNGGINMVDSANFKTGKIRELAKKAPWVVFIDDSTDFVEAVLRDGIENCLVINIPQGKILPNFRHERLIVIKRFPEDLQAMYPLKFMIDKAIDNASNK